MSLVIREAHPKEYAEVARITVAAYEEYAATLTPDDWTHYREDLSDAAGRAEGYASVRALAVSPQARGQGVGRALTVACIERARTEGANGIGLNTTSLMPVAQAMYERMGFRQLPEAWTAPSGLIVISYLLDFKDVA